MVDLEDVHGEAAEVGERGVAGAEVVDGDLDADRLQGLEGADGDVQVVHQYALGDLHAERAGRETGAAERLLHDVGKLGACQLPAGQVDRDAVWRTVRCHFTPAG